MDADQATLSETVNTYAIILGQAQVVKSVTTSDAAKLVGGKLEVIGKTEVVGGVTSLSHGWGTRYRTGGWTMRRRLRE
ncbi:MAG: hypothetical protein IPL32_20510 [Chloracidobacterium sp.]|nr:hypothetical protein [Chloracidobacterium sp.]